MHSGAGRLISTVANTASRRQDVVLRRALYLQVEHAKRESLLHLLAVPQQVQASYVL